MEELRFSVEWPQYFFQRHLAHLFRTQYKMWRTGKLKLQETRCAPYSCPCSKIKTSCFKRDTERERGADSSILIYFKHRGSGRRSKMAPKEAISLQDTQADLLKPAAWGHLYYTPDVFADMLIKVEWVLLFLWLVYLFDFYKEFIVSYDCWINGVPMLFSWTGQQRNENSEMNSCKHSDLCLFAIQ